MPITTFLGPAFEGSGPDASFLLSLAAFVLPAALLSAVAPVIVRATLRDVEGSGSVVGRLSAVGTAGALTGTFLTGYVLLGLVPVRALPFGSCSTSSGVVVVTGDEPGSTSPLPPPWPAPTLDPPPPDAPLTDTARSRRPSRLGLAIAVAVVLL